MHREASQPPVTVEEAAKRLGISHWQVRELLKRRLLPFYKIGRAVRIHPDDIEHYLAASYQPATGIPLPEPVQPEKPKRAKSSQAVGFKHLRRFGWAPKGGATKVQNN